MASPRWSDDTCTDLPPIEGMLARASDPVLVAPIPWEPIESTGSFSLPKELSSPVLEYASSLPPSQIVESIHPATQFPTSSRPVGKGKARTRSSISSARHATAARPTGSHTSRTRSAAGSRPASRAASHPLSSPESISSGLPSCHPSPSPLERTPTAHRVLGHVTNVGTVPPIDFDPCTPANSIAPSILRGLGSHDAQTMGQHFITEAQWIREGPNWAANILGLDSGNDAIFGADRGPLPFDGPRVVAPEPIPINTDFSTMTSNDRDANIELLSIAVNALTNNQQVLLNRSEFLMAASLFNASETNATVRAIHEDVARIKLEMLEMSASLTRVRPGPPGDFNIERILDNTVPASQFDVARVDESVSSLAAQLASLQKLITESLKTPTATAPPPPPPAGPCHTSVPQGPPRPQPNFSTRPTNKTTDPFAGLTHGANWFAAKLSSLSDENVGWWARVLAMGKWGELNDKGFPSGCNWNSPLGLKRNFVMGCIHWAFSPGSYGFLPLPPTSYVDSNYKISTTQYSWLCYSGTGQMPRNSTGTISVAFSPGFKPSQPLTATPLPAQTSAPAPVPVPPPVAPTVPVRNFTPPPNQPPPPPPRQETPKDDDVYYEDLHAPTSGPWQEHSNKKGKRNASYADISSRNATAPQPAPVRPQRTPITDEKWVIHFPQKDKPHAGSRLPSSVITDKINMACGSTYNIKAIIADWTATGNISLGPPPPRTSQMHPEPSLGLSPQVSREPLLARWFRSPNSYTAMSPARSSPYLRSMATKWPRMSSGTRKISSKQSATLMKSSITPRSSTSPTGWLLNFDQTR